MAHTAHTALPATLTHPTRPQREGTHQVIVMNWGIWLVLGRAPGGVGQSARLAGVQGKAAGRRAGAGAANAMFTNGGTFGQHADNTVGD